MDKDLIVETVIEVLQQHGYIIRKTEEEKFMKTYKSGFFTQEKYIKSYTSLPKGRQLITEYDVKTYLKTHPGAKEIEIPEKAIISPLAEDLIYSLGLKVIRKK